MPIKVHPGQIIHANAHCDLADQMFEFEADLNQIRNWNPWNQLHHSRTSRHPALAKKAGYRNPALGGGPKGWRKGGQLCTDVVLALTL